MAKVAIGKEVATLASRGLLGDNGDLLTPWVNSQVRIELERRADGIQLDAKAGAISKDGEGKASFSGRELKASVVNHAYVLFRLGQFVMATEKKLADEFGMFHAMEGLKLPRTVSAWLEENEARALELFTKLDIRSADGIAAQGRAKALLAEIAESEEEAQAQELVPA